MKTKEKGGILTTKNQIRTMYLAATLLGGLSFYEAARTDPNRQWLSEREVQKKIAQNYGEYKERCMDSFTRAVKDWSVGNFPVQPTQNQLSACMRREAREGKVQNNFLESPSFLAAIFAAAGAWVGVNAFSHPWPQDSVPSAGTDKVPARSAPQRRSASGQVNPGHLRLVGKKESASTITASEPDDLVS